MRKRNLFRELVEVAKLALEEKNLLVFFNALDILADLYPHVRHEVAYASLTRDLSRLERLALCIA